MKRLKWIITILIGATIFRAQTVLFLSSVEAFGGPAPNAWFGPWLSDAILGFLVPAVLFVFWKCKGARVWGFLVIYNSIGAFDYSQGLLTQALSPMPIEMASASTVYIGIGIFMFFQLIALGLLFQRDIVDHYFEK